MSLALDAEVAKKTDKTELDAKANKADVVTTQTTAAAVANAQTSAVAAKHWLKKA